MNYRAHNDLLSQVAESNYERDEVRRILTGLTERELDESNAHHSWPAIPRRRKPIGPWLFVFALGFVAFCGAILPMSIHWIFN